MKSGTFLRGRLLTLDLYMTSSRSMIRILNYFSCEEVTVGEHTSLCGLTAGSVNEDEKDIRRGFFVIGGEQKFYGEVYPNGTHHYPNGAHHYPNGAHHYPNGTHNYPNGTHHYPNGTHHYPNGTHHYPNGTHHYPNRPTIIPMGPTIIPIGPPLSQRDPPLS
jgi:hypothetical protein